MSNVIDISDARQRKKFPPLQLVPDADMADKMRWLRIMAKAREVERPSDTEPPEGPRAA